MRPRQIDEVVAVAIISHGMCLTLVYDSPMSYLRTPFTYPIKHLVASMSCVEPPANYPIEILFIQNATLFKPKC